MRSVSSQLQTFLDANTNATWRHLVRFTLSDGTIYRWTDHSSDLTGSDLTITATAGVNDTLDYTLESFPRTVTLTPGTYTAATLATEVQAKMQADFDNAWSVTVTGGKLRINGTSGGTWAPKGTTGTNHAKQAWTLLGFLASDYTENASDRTAPNAPGVGFTYTAGGTGTVPLIKVGTRRDPAGTEIGECELTLLTGEGAQIGGVHLPLAVVNDALDGAKVKIERVYGATGPDTTLGTMHVFEGVVAECEPSSTEVRLSLVDARETLNVQLPRTSIQPPCTAMLFDGQCSLSKATWTVTGSVVAGGDSIKVRSNRTEANGYFALGVITFTSGANNGVKRAVRAFKNTNGEFELAEALPAVPAAGDTFSVYPGCDKTWNGTNGCAKFNNKSHHRGFPVLPKEATDTRMRWRPNPEYVTTYYTDFIGQDAQNTPNDIVLPIVYGRNKLDGTTIYRANLHSATSLMVAFCEGPIVDGRRFWINSSFYSSIHKLDGVKAMHPFSIHDGGYDAATLYLGTRPTQASWWWLSIMDPTYLVTYPGTCVWACSNRPLPAGQTETYSLEIDGFLSNAGDAGANGDAHPASILADPTYGLLTNSTFGAGFQWPVSTDYGADGTVSSSARRYLTAAGIYLSPVIKERRKALDILQELLDSTNCSCRMSDGTLEIIPLGDVSFTGSGYTYNPVTTAQYALNEDDFLGSGDPVEVKRSAREEIVNIVPVEFTERDPTASATNPSHAYVSRVIEDPEPVDVALNGTRRGATVSLPMITLKDVALTISRLRAQKATKQRNTYRFKIGWHFARLEPLDYVTLTDSRFGLADRVVRVQSVEEDADGTLTVEAEDAPLGMSHAVAHEVQSSESTFTGLPYVPSDVVTHTTAALNWTPRSIGTGDWQSVTWNGSVFCAVGKGSKCATSPDGITWTTRTITAADWYDVAWNGEVFCAVGQTLAGNPPKCATSPDGITWTARTIASSGPPTAWFTRGIAWNGSVFCTILSDDFAYQARAFTSPDGITWTQQSGGDLNGTAGNGIYWNGITWNGTVFAAAGRNGNARQVATSADGVTWTKHALPNTFSPISIGASDTGTMVVTGYTTSPDQAACYTSTDNGTTWAQATITSTGSAYYMGAVTWTGAIFVAMNNSSGAGSGSCFVSADGLTWRTVTTGIPATYYAYRGLCWNGSSLMAVGVGTAAASQAV